MANEPSQIADIKFDRRNLYREETITDLKVGTIQRLTPIKVDGTKDQSPPRHLRGPDATPLAGWTRAGFLAHRGGDSRRGDPSVPETMQKAVEKLVDDVKQLQREQMNRIVVPGQAPGGSKIIT